MIGLEGMNSDLVIRGCSVLDMKNECRKEKNKEGEVVECFCDTSLCNSANQKYYTVVSIVMTTIVLFNFQ